MAKRNEHVDPDGLQLRTLSGVYESARGVVRNIQIDKLATYEQFKKRLVAITRKPDQVKELYMALDQLDKSSRKLGLTTLVAPTAHPLVTRVPFVEKEEKG